MAVLDVRPDLARGEEPFGRIMAAVKLLAPGEPLTLLAPFEPRPLYGKMAGQGFGRRAERLDDGTWRVTFTRTQEGPRPSGAAEDRRRYGATEWSRWRFYRPFVTAALIVALTLGFTTGAAMLLIPALGLPVGAWWVSHAQAHGVAQVFGWSGLFVMGVAFHVVPRLRRGAIAGPWPQRATLALILAAVTLRFLGGSLHAHPAGRLMLAVSGVLLAAGVLAFAYAIGGALRKGDAPRTITDAWLWTALGWAVAAAFMHLGVVWEMARTSAVAAPADWDRAFVRAALLGFLGAFAFGISGHAVIGFLGLRPLRRRPGWAALVLLNVGVTLDVLGSIAAWRVVGGAGEVAEAAGLLAFVVSLWPFSGPGQRRPPLVGAYGRHAWFVRAAYGWLCVAAALMALEGVQRTGVVAPLRAMTAAPVLHVYVLGFLTMLIMGMGTRMLPLFQRTALPSHRAMDVAFVLLNASVVLRVVFGLWPSGLAPQALGLSGVLGLAALCLFAWVIWRVLRARPAEGGPGAPPVERVAVSFRGRTGLATRPRQG